MKKIFILSILILCYSFCSYAQDKKIRTKFEAGEIMTLKDKMLFDDDFVQSHTPYQENMVGVATGNNNPQKKSDILIKEGIAIVKITNENGIIKKGDFITSSSIKGLGMKAIKSGMVIGVALEDEELNSGQVKIRVLIQYLKQ